MKSNDHVPPKWIAVRIDETEHWCDEKLVEQAGKIWVVYLIDANSVTYCCELTPSHELHYVESVPENMLEDDREDEQMRDTIREDGCAEDYISYVHVHDINALSEQNKHDLKLESDDDYWWKEENDRGFDTALEAYQGSPRW